MEELLTTIFAWFQAISSYKITDFFSFFTAILKVFGFPGEIVSPSDMSQVADWIVSMFGPLGGVYELVLRYLSAEQFIQIVDKILAFFNR